MRPRPYAWRRRSTHPLYVRGWAPAYTAPKPPGGDEPALYVWGWGPSCTAPPHAWRRRPSPPLYVRGWAPGYEAPKYAWRRRTPYGPHMSGVGPPAIRPRPWPEANHTGLWVPQNPPFVVFGSTRRFCR
eukprot:gene17911-biopygen21902